MYKCFWYCRWCGNEYTPVKQTDRDGFDTKACKQAHHRAYKKYVTQNLRSQKVKKKTGGVGNDGT